MAEQVSFWQRMRSILNPGAELRDGPGTNRPAGGALEKRGIHPGGTSWWRRPARNAQRQELALRMVELAEALQQHFKAQDTRSAELTGSLARVGGVLEQLAEAQRSQGECLRAIADHTEAAGKSTAALTSALGRMPESLAAQAEAIRTVARQMEIAHESDNQLMHSLQQFGRAVDTLGSSGTAQVEVLQRLNAAEREQHEALSTLVREQSRRFVVILAITAVLALAVLGALVAAFALRVVP
jgi:hypothetical protein